MEGMRDTRRRRAVSVVLGVVLVLSVFGLTGCKLELSLDTDIDVDGSGSVGITLAADEEMQQLLAQQANGEGDVFSEFENEIPEGWESETGTDEDGTRWVRASREFSDPEELSLALEEAAAGEQLPAQEFSLEQEGGFLEVTTRYRSVWSMQEALEGADEGLPEGFGPEALSGVFEVRNEVTLPGSIEGHNADEVQGNTLIWTPGFGGTTEMQAESSAYRWGMLLGILIAGIVVIAAVVAVVVMVAARRGEKEAEADFDYDADRYPEGEGEAGDAGDTD